MRAKIVNQSSDFPVRRTGSYRHKKALVLRCLQEVCSTTGQARFLQLTDYHTYTPDYPPIVKVMCNWKSVCCY